MMKEYCKLYAVCIKGCPEPVDGGKWPAGATFENTEWEVYDDAVPAANEEQRRVGVAPRTVTGVSAKCCKRKPWECDVCTHDMCRGFFGMCPNHILHPLAAKCCVPYTGPVIPLPQCICKSPEPYHVCDHSSEQGEVLADGEDDGDDVTEMWI